MQIVSTEPDLPAIEFLKLWNFGKSIIIIRWGISYRDTIMVYKYYSFDIIGKQLIKISKIKWSSQETN